jgi:hypothetical protein
VIVITLLMLSYLDVDLSVAFKEQVNNALLSHVSTTVGSDRPFKDPFSWRTPPPNIWAVNFHFCFVLWIWFRS